MKMTRLVKMPNLLPMLSQLGRDWNYTASGLYRPLTVTYSGPSLPRDLAANLDSILWSDVVQHGPRPVAPGA